MTALAGSARHSSVRLSPVRLSSVRVDGAVTAAAGVGAAIACAASPWVLTPPLWLAAVASLLCGLWVAGTVGLVWWVLRRVGTVLRQRRAVLPLLLAGILAAGLPAPASAAPSTAADVVALGADAGGAGGAAGTVGRGAVGGTVGAVGRGAVGGAVGAVGRGAVGEAGGTVAPRAVGTVASDAPEGRAFLALPTTTAVTPIRVYVDRAAAADDAGRAALAVETLRRAGGLDRPDVLVVVPTGSGWVDPAAVAAYERQHGGDLATVVVQYAQRPSWVEYVVGGDAAERSAAAVLSAVRAALEPGQRLLVFGESLGAAAVLPVAGLADDCLLAGRPGSQGGTGPCTELRNPDDPVVRWSPGLLATDPVEFWQVTAALLIAQDAGADHGHRYDRGIAAALRASAVQR